MSLTSDQDCWSWNKTQRAFCLSMSYSYPMLSEGSWADPSDVWHEAPVIYDLAYIALSDSKWQTIHSSTIQSFECLHFFLFTYFYVENYNTRSSLWAHLFEEVGSFYSWCPLFSVILSIWYSCTIGNLVVEDSKDDFAETDFDWSKASTEI